MSEQRAERGANRPAKASPVERLAAPATCRARPGDEAAVCPACGEEMRLWANYHRCQNCGYKESCCF